MAIKFIKNTDDATIVCRITSDRSKAYVFKPKKFDKRNNVVISTGFTEITEEEILLLEKESKTYTSYMKLGKLTVVDSLPLDAMSTEQLIITLRTENADLKRALQNNSNSDNEKKLQKELEIVQKKLEEQQAIIEKQQSIIDELTKEKAEKGKE